MLTDEIKKILIPIKNEKFLIICIGNTFRKDDGAGPYIAENLKISDKDLLIMNAGDRPENIIDEAINIKAKKIVIIDAADFYGHPGEIRVIPVDLIPEKTLSTHTFPVKIIAKMLEYDSQSNVYFLGIQIKDINLGEGLSTEVKNTADKIIDFLKDRGKSIFHSI